MNQNSNNEFNSYQRNGGFSNNNQEVNNNNFNNISDVNQVNNTNNYESQNNEVINTSNINAYQQPVNEVPSTNTNIESNENDNKGISKIGKIMMFVVLISTLFIFFDNFITSMDWYWRLQIQAAFNHDDQLKLGLDTFAELIQVINWGIVLIITILSIIFLIIDKKKKNSIQIYEWYIVTGIFHIFVGTEGLTILMYSIVTLVFSIKNKKKNKVKNISIKNDKVLIIFSLITILLTILWYVNDSMGLFSKIEKKVDDYKDSKEVIIEDKDNNHIVTTFDNILNDWGNNVAKNK